MSDPSEENGPSALPNPTVLALAIGLGCMVNPLNGTLIAMGFTEIAKGFDHSLAETTWLITLYMAATASVQPIAGALGDWLGRRGSYLIGVGAFGLASAAAALATSFPALVAFRCLQAVFSAILMPNGQALLRDGVPASVRGRAVGTLAATMGIGAVLGLPLGGWMVGRFGWRSLFWLSLPVAVVALALGIAILPRSTRARPRLSPVAAIGAALVPLTIGLQLLAKEASRASSIPFFVAAAALLTGAVMLILRSPEGRDDLLRLGDRWYLGSLAMTWLQNVLFYAAVFIGPPWLQGSLGLEPRYVGMILGGSLGVMVITTPVAGRLVDQRGPRLPAILGFAAIAGCLAVLVWPADGPSLTRVIVGLGLLGMGMGLSQPAVQRQALDAAPPEATAMAMGLFSSTRYLGGIVGAAVLTTQLVHGAIVSFAPGVALMRSLLFFCALPTLLISMVVSSPKRLVDQRTSQVPEPSPPCPPRAETGPRS